MNHLSMIKIIAVPLIMGISCQSPPNTPPLRNMSPSFTNPRGQMMQELDSEVASTVVGDSALNGGQELIEAGDEMGNVLTTNDMSSGSVMNDMDLNLTEAPDSLIGDPDMESPLIDMAVEEDIIPPIELPESCTGPLEEPIANCYPGVLPSTGDLYEDCVRRINQLRAECQCLPPLEYWLEGEDCANEQAEYDAVNNQAHAGFNAGICGPSGRGQNECPGYQSENQVISLCLQQMWDEGPGESFQQHGHYINMTNPGHQRVACGFFTSEQGQVWAIQNFSP